MLRTTITAICLLGSASVLAGDIIVDMHKIDEKGVGQAIGTVTIKQLVNGVELSPKLRDLPPGDHGFHIHEKPACGQGDKDGKTVAGLAAGSHFDPEQTGKHLGPKGEGHKGDLPALQVSPEGTATTPVIREKLTMSDLAGRSLMIHADPDNYADKPGGARIACGVIH